MKEISLIGSTGSIGRQVCAVVRRYPEKFTIKSMVANASAEAFLRQLEEFKPAYAALVNEDEGKKIADRIPQGVRFGYGKRAALDAVHYGETAFVAATGFAGLEYSLEAVAQGKDIALANKETLVCGGELVMRSIRGAGIRLMPVDSEHSALWQALSFRLNRCQTPKIPCGWDLNLNNRLFREDFAIFFARSSLFFVLMWQSICFDAPFHM